MAKKKPRCGWCDERLEESGVEVFGIELGSDRTERWHMKCAEVHAFRDRNGLSYVALLGNST